MTSPSVADFKYITDLPFLLFWSSGVRPSIEGRRECCFELLLAGEPLVAS